MNINKFPKVLISLLVVLSLIDISFSKSIGNKWLSKFFKNIDNISSNVVERKLKQFSKFKRDLDEFSEKSLRKAPKLVSEKEKLKLFAVELSKKNPKVIPILNNTTKDNAVETLFFIKTYGDKFVNVSNESLEVWRKIDVKSVLNKVKNPKLRQKIKIPFSEKEVISKIVDITKYTGEKGLKVGKELISLTKRHPKSTAAIVAFLWYLNDPNGFLENLDRFGDNLSDFVSAIASEVAETSAEIVFKSSKNIADKTANAIKENFSYGGLIVLLISGTGILAFFLYKKRELVMKIFNINNERKTISTNNYKNTNNNSNISIKKQKNESFDNDEEEGLL